MGRRLAAVAQGVLVAAGVISILSRRQGTFTPEPRDDVLRHGSHTEAAAAKLAVQTDDQCDDHAPHPSAPLPSPFYEGEGSPAAEPLSEVLPRLVDPYLVDPGKKLQLRLALRDVAGALERGDLHEGTVVVDLAWSPGAGVLIDLAIAVLATSSYVRINVCDLNGNLVAPELDVHLRGNDVRVLPDQTSRVVDLEERRSEAVVTKHKLKAIAEGRPVHPGDASAVLERCRIIRSPFDIEQDMHLPR
ncbi:hypothetical protein [Sphingomonas sp. 3-13AW]|uniref:hypothetical protein n=1 Tax=Sphingomonas sp. 3-13AW TaxID=3050450 RepID=UPI003BB7B35E